MASSKKTTASVAVDANGNKHFYESKGGHETNGVPRDQIITSSYVLEETGKGTSIEAKGAFRHQHNAKAVADKAAPVLAVANPLLAIPGVRDAVIDVAADAARLVTGKKPKGIQ